MAERIMRRAGIERLIAVTASGVPTIDQTRRPPRVARPPGAQPLLTARLPAPPEGAIAVVARGLVKTGSAVVIARFRLTALATEIGRRQGDAAA